MGGGGWIGIRLWACLSLGGNEPKEGTQGGRKRGKAKEREKVCTYASRLVCGIRDVNMIKYGYQYDLIRTSI